MFLSNKICLNLIITFVMSRNKHISKKTPCFSRKRSKNKAKPNEFERHMLKLSCYACSDNPKCWHAISIFRMRVARMNFDLTFNTLYDWDFPCHATIIEDLKIAWNWMKTRHDSLVQLKSGRDLHWHFRIWQHFCHTSRVWMQAFKARLCM